MGGVSEIKAWQSISLGEDEVEELIKGNFLIAILVNSNQHHLGLILVNFQTHLIKHDLNVIRVQVALAALVPVFEDVLYIGSGWISSSESSDDILNFR